MKGKVVLMNPRRGMAALMTEDGDYTSFEILGSDLELGDILSGNLEALGGETWYNETQLEEVDVYVEDIYGSKYTASKIIS